MDPKDNEPFHREPWRRLLRAGSGDPSRVIDRRILTQARRAIEPRAARWWLPASLAASLLLAVLIARWQFEDTSAPPLVSESDVVPEPKTGDEHPPAAAPPAAAPAATLEHAESATRTAEDTAARSMMHAPAVSAAQKSGAAADAAVAPLTPEEWYAQIEALRAAGHIAKADAELVRLEAAYPGWLARHRASLPVEHD